MSHRRDVLDWLLGGDVAVAHQTTRDLLHDEDPALRARIATEGAGAVMLAARRGDGHWGRGFYQPKWTSTHYTLLELRNLGLPRDHPAAVESVQLVLAHERGLDRGLSANHRVRHSDTCVTGMGLNYASWFSAPEADLTELVDVLLAGRVDDGGFNCEHRVPEHPVAHSSLDTTVSVIEGFTSYLAAGHRHRRDDVRRAVGTAAEFVLRHELFRSERTGEVVRAHYLVPHHPPRWHFDVLRGLDCLAAAGVAPDPRMGAALETLLDRRRPDGRWTARRWPGETHHPPAAGRSPSPWATLAALRVLEHYPVGRPTV
ncbi:conserved hypothetical protein [metagenome]|uniref:Prenyltransferase n=1 Tax=metagenome TaxID=256318 RepID=A0A2P2C677_9ZZZZ